MSNAANTQDNPLLAIRELGQSLWYDYIRRDLLSSGEFARLIAEDGLAGVTSNPSIWDKAISDSDDYDEAIAALHRERVRDPVAIYEQLAIADIRAAADALRPVYEATARADGYACIEVAPALAHDTARTIADAERLWKAIDRENLMIKVPATAAGIPAIRALTARAVNVNITLLFAIPVYEQVAEAYISGLEDLAASGGALERVASVASFFVSRIDSAVNARLQQIAARDPESERRARAIEGKVAIANAKLAYESYERTVAGARWRALSEQGAHPQRLLWASTSTKDPSYSDVLYVQELIGPDTVNTVTPATLEAFRDHGRPRASLREGVGAARDDLATLAELGIALEQVTTELTGNGIELFKRAFADLLSAIDRSRAPVAAR